jgi:hypothetical protein
MPEALQCDVFLSHSAKDKATAPSSSKALTGYSSNLALFPPGREQLRSPANLEGSRLGV